MASGYDKISNPEEDKIMMRFFVAFVVVYTVLFILGIIGMFANLLLRIGCT